MANELQPVHRTPNPLQSKQWSDTFRRIAKYSVQRLVVLFITVVIGLYITVLIANQGGYVDQIRKAQIRESVGQMMAVNPEVQRLTQSQIIDIQQREIALEEERLGLHLPFALRSVMYLQQAITLNLGNAEYMTSDSGSRRVRNIILERLAPTLVLFLTANLILFGSAILIALFLSRRYGSFLDRAVVALTPTSAAPSWFYGMFLILLFSALWRMMPFGGMVAAPPPSGIHYYFSVAKHLVLPIAAIFLGAIFQSVYSWRTFFLIYSSEDYVEMAKAKGMTSSMIERRYVLKPTLPTIITSFALTLIYAWQGQIILETVFNWPGLGRLLYQAIGFNDIPIVVGSTVIFAYLLAITVFLLDIIYALVDPRVKVGNGGARA